MDALLGTGLSHDEVARRDSKILDVGLELGLDKAFEFVVDSRVVQSVLLSVLEYDALFLDEANDRVFPNRRLQVLTEDLEDPLLQDT